MRSSSSSSNNKLKWGKAATARSLSARRSIANASMQEFTVAQIATANNASTFWLRRRTYFITLRLRIPWSMNSHSTRFHTTLKNEPNYDLNYFCYKWCVILCLLMVLPQLKAPKGNTKAIVELIQWWTIKDLPKQGRNLSNTSSHHKSMNFCNPSNWKIRSTKSNRLHRNLWWV